jgi:hypothetical protein
MAEQLGYERGEAPPPGVDQSPVACPDSVVPWCTPAGFAFEGGVERLHEGVEQHQRHRLLRAGPRAVSS